LIFGLESQNLYITTVPLVSTWRSEGPDERLLVPEENPFWWRKDRREHLASQKYKV